MLNFEHLQSLGSVRHVEIDGVMYYAVIDIFKLCFPSNSNPRMRWKLAQGHLLRQGFDMESQLIFYQL